MATLSQRQAPDRSRDRVLQHVAETLNQQPVAHRLVPFALEAARLRQRAARGWSAQGYLHDRALLQLRYLLGRSARAAAVEQLGAAYLYESYRRYAARFRPWLMDAVPIDGIDVLRSMHDQGRGVVL